MIDDTNRNKSGRGYSKYTYTVKDIARATRRAEGTVRNDINHGKVELASLVSVSVYVAKHVERLSE